MELTAENVNTIFMDCLWADHEVVGFENDLFAHSKCVHGIRINVGFNPTKLTAHAAEIADMLQQLPEDFTAGGGASFLSACMRKDGVQWGEHRNMEELFVLGMGIDKVACLLPRDLWGILPGGMPYYAITA